jgi:hypothetical protein
MPPGTYHLPQPPNATSVAIGREAVMAMRLPLTPRQVLEQLMSEPTTKQTTKLTTKAHPSLLTRRAQERFGHHELACSVWWKEQRIGPG